MASKQQAAGQIHQTQTCLNKLIFSLELKLNFYSRGKKVARQRTVDSQGDRVAPVPWGQCQAAGLLKTFCCISLSACSICRGTIGASPGLNLSAQSAAAPCNIYTGCLHGPGSAHYSHHSTARRGVTCALKSCRPLCHLHVQTDFVTTEEKVFPDDALAAGSLRLQNKNVKWFM